MSEFVQVEVRPADVSIETTASLTHAALLGQRLYYRERFEQLRERGIELGEYQKENVRSLPISFADTVGSLFNDGAIPDIETIVNTVETDSSTDARTNRIESIQAKLAEQSSVNSEQFQNETAFDELSLLSGLKVAVYASTEEIPGRELTFTYKHRDPSHMWMVFGKQSVINKAYLYKENTHVFDVDRPNRNNLHGKLQEVSSLIDQKIVPLRSGYGTGDSKMYFLTEPVDNDDQEVLSLWMLFDCSGEDHGLISNFEVIGTIPNEQRRTDPVELTLTAEDAELFKLTPKASESP